MNFAFLRSGIRLSLATLLAWFFALGLPVCWGQVLNENFKLLPSDGEVADEFGRCVAIDNGIVAVGAVYHDNGQFGSSAGKAYLFDASTGAQLRTLLPIDVAAEDFFGNSIAIDNGIVAVGASGDDDNGSKSGSAYLFDATTGQQLHKLLPNDGTANDRFGWSIAIDGGIVAVGAAWDGDNGEKSGSAYLFDATTGQQLRKLLPTDGASGDQFGSSIAIDNGIVAVGAHNTGDYSGSAYLFDASTGTQRCQLLASDGAAHDSFGWSISIDNGVVAVGANGDDDNGFNSGSAYLFDATTGAQLHKLLPNDGEFIKQFGGSIAMNNGIVAVGARGDDEYGTDSGSAYLFDATTYAQLYKLLPSDGAAWDRFGESIAIENGAVVVGAHKDDDNGEESGSAYLFDVSGGDAVTANQFTVYRGLQIAGLLSDSIESDDSYLKFNPAFTINSSEAPVWLIFDGTLPSDNPASLEIVMESNVGTPGLTHTLEAWNWTSAAYDVFDVSAASFNDDVVVTASLSSGISNYAQAGTGAVRTRVGWRKTGLTINYPWEVRLDQMVWIVQ